MPAGWIAKNTHTLYALACPQGSLPVYREYSETCVWGVQKGRLYTGEITCFVNSAAVTNGNAWWNGVQRNSFAFSLSHPSPASPLLLAKVFPRARLSLTVHHAEGDVTIRRSLNRNSQSRRAYKLWHNGKCKLYAASHSNRNLSTRREGVRGRQRQWMAELRYQSYSTVSQAAVGMEIR